MPFDELPCPCCARHALKLCERTRNLDGDACHILVCSFCTALVNLEELTRTDQAELQISASVEVYSAWDMREKVEASRSLVDYFERQAGGLEGKTLLDFGYGSGAVMIAAASRARQVIGVDLNPATFLETLRQMPDAPTNIRVMDVFEPADVIVCWHTLEHLPNPREIVREMACVLRPGGCLLAQVPLYRPQYLCRTHITFFNATAAGALLEGAWETPAIEFDDHNAFLTITATVRK